MMSFFFVPSQNSTRSKPWFFIILSILLLAVSCSPKEKKQGSQANSVVRGYIATNIDANQGKGHKLAFRLDGEDIYLPNIAVFLLNLGTETKSDPVITDLSGRFTFPAQPPGRYKVCWEVPGFGANCSDRIFSVTNKPVFLSKIVILPEPKQGTTMVAGSVFMGDGSLPRTLEPMASINSFAWVVLSDDLGNSIYKTPVNNFGYYFLPQVPVQKKIEIRAFIEEAEARQIIFPEAQLGEAFFHQIDLKFRNKPPRLNPIVATDQNGRRVKTTDPGAILHLEGTVSDPDKDPVKFQWLVAAGSGAVDDINAASVKWELPSHPGLYTISLIASDDKGGYSKSSLAIRADGRGIPFSGIVSATDIATVAGAKVEINGKSTVTDSNGYFRIFVRDVDRFVFNIRKSGYGFYSKIYDDGVTGGQWQLRPATVGIADPRGPIEAVDKPNSLSCPGPLSSRVNWQELDYLKRVTWQDGKGNVIHPPERQNVPLPWEKKYRGDKQPPCGPGIRVLIEPDSLVDTNGNPPPGNVEISLATIDLMSPEQMPGDYTVDTASGFRVMQSYGAGSIEVSAGGKSYDLRPGATAKIAIPVDPAQLSAPGALPATIPLLVYDENKGLWYEDGTAILQGLNYIATVKHFSTFNIDLVKTNQSCVRIQSPTLDGAYTLEITIPQTGGAAPVVRTYNVDNLAPSEHVVYNLPSNTNIVLVPYRNSDNLPYGLFVVNTGGPQNPTNPNLPAGPPYVACSTEVIFDNQIMPPTGGVFLKGLSSFSATNLGSLSPADAALYETMTQDYYSQIDPRSKRLTLVDFKTENGFDGTEIRGVFANSGDLGFGRDMYCKKVGLDVACYVTNYGDEPSNDQDDANDAIAGLAPVATVAMEFSRIESQPTEPVEFDDPERVVKFYVYNNFGTILLNNADLDGQGARPVPQLCMVCHNGVYPGGGSPAIPGFNNREDVKLGSRFIPFDVAEFTFPNVAGFDKASQQPVFKQLNEDIVRATEPLNSSIDEVITGMYSGGPVQSEDFVVTGWNGQPNEQVMYREVVARTCRTCHVANVFPSLQFTASTQVANLLGQAESRVCVQNVMPHALRTHKNFWTSVGPNMVAQFQVFGDAFGNAGNGWQGDKCGVFTAGGVTPQTLYESEIQDIWDGISTGGVTPCTNCHIGSFPAQGLNLSAPGSHGQLVNVLSTLPGVSLPLVNPFNAFDSFLIHKVEGSQSVGAQMPQGGPPFLSLALIQAIRDWIDNGAEP